MPIQRRQIPDYAALSCLGATLIVLALVGLLSYQTTQRFLLNDAKVDRTHRVLEALQRVLADLTDAETGQRGFVITGDPQYLQPYASGTAAVRSDLDRVRSLTRDNPAQQRRLDTLDALATAKLAELDKTIALRRRSGGISAVLPVIESGRGKSLMDQARLVVGAMDGENRALLAKRTQAAETAGREAQRFTVAGFMLGVLLVAISAIVMFRYIRERKLSEGKVLAQVGRLALLHQITRAIGERQDLQSILQAPIRSLEDNLPIDFGCVGLYDQPNNTITVIRVGVKSSPLAMELAMPEQAVINIDENGLSRCVRGQLVYEPDIADVKFPFPQRLAEGGLRSLVIAPLLVESKVFGVFVAARRLPHSFSSGECEFLKQLSEHVALAMHQSQLYGALEQAYNDLQQTQQAVMQQERLRALGQMASGIAHDINNAISPVALYTEALLETEPNLSDRARDFLETIQRAIQDVAQTVVRMREFYRQREPQLSLTPVNLNSLVQHVVNLTKARWSDMPQQRGVVVELKTELAEGLPAIMGAENEIREALTNLVFNAVDAMPEGGVLTVRTIAEPPDAAGQRHASVEVSDTGIGMDDDTRRRCLEPFYTTKGERGTGLGLAMVYGVVQRHSAEIDFESAVGKGTTVRLTFPAPTEVLADSTPRPVAGAKLSGLRILIVDDDPLLLKSLKDTLEMDRHAITAASGGQAGIDTFRARRTVEPFDVVITDLGMPYIDGRKVASSIKEISPKVPIILLTGWGQRLIAERDIPQHVNIVLNKPPKLSDLREALVRCVLKTGSD